MTILQQSDHIEYVRWKDLFLSHLNVRKDKSDAGIRELAELIAAEGVLQNLVGYRETKGKGKNKKTRVVVVAGGRRYRAVGLLIDEGRLTNEIVIPCLLTTPERAVSKSLVENTGRLDLHPADQFEAFRDLVKEGRSVVEIAAAFSVSDLVVRRRLRLANVHPDFLAFYRNGEIKLDHMMALAVTDDTKRQQAAWKALPESQRTPEALRRLLTESEIALNRPLAKYVGLEAYEAAGGSVRNDLFAEDPEVGTLLMDPALVERLARAKLEKEAEVLRPEAGAWIEISPRLDLADFAAYKHARTIEREPTAEESARLSAIDKERSALETRQFDLECEDSEEGDGDLDEEDVDEVEDDGTAEEGKGVRMPASDADARELQTIQDRLYELDREEEAINEGLEIVDPGEALFAGTLLSINSKGQVNVSKGLIKAEDVKRLREAPGQGAGGTEQPVKKTKAGQSGAMFLRLSAHRTQALQATLVDDTKVALAALCQRLLSATILNGRGAKSPLSIGVDRVALDNYADDLQGTPAYVKLQARTEDWEKRLPSDPKALLPWLLQQSDATIGELLAFCTALSLDAVKGQAGSTDADELAGAAHLNMADWWSPTAQGYLGKIKKDDILAIVSQHVCREKAAVIERLKKPAMAKEAEKLLVGSRWVPDYFKEVQAA